MRSRRRDGMVRRPAEYVLLVIVGLLIAILLWAALSLRHENQSVDSQKSSSAQPLEGTIEEINWLTEHDISDERSADALVYDKDQRLAQSLDAASDNIGAAVDENTIPRNICEELGSFKQRTASSFADKSTAFDESKISTNAGLRERTDRMMTTVATSRQAMDARRVTSFKLLEERSGDQNTELVRSYGQSIDQIVGVRRQQFDDARLQFASDVQQLISVRQNAIEDARQTFKSAVDSAIIVSERACLRRNRDESGIRSELARVIHGSRLAYAEVLRARLDVGTRLKEIETLRNTAYAQATEQFERSVRDIQSLYGDLRR